MLVTAYMALFVLFGWSLETSLNYVSKDVVIFRFWPIPISQKLFTEMADKQSIFKIILST